MQVAIQTGQFVVAPPSLVITSGPLPGGTQGTPYNFQCAASGGVPPYSWSASGLPAGVGISSSTGFISGVPTVNGTFNYTITCQDQSP